MLAAGLPPYGNRASIRYLFVTRREENNPPGPTSRCKNGSNDVRKVIVIVFPSVCGS